MLSDEGGDGTISSIVRRARSSRGAFRTAPADLGGLAEVRRVAFRAACLRAGVARRAGRFAERAGRFAERAGRFAERFAAADFRAGFAFLTPRRALRLAI
jgi:hypothetical protein